MHRAVPVVVLLGLTVVLTPIVGGSSAGSISPSIESTPVSSANLLQESKSVPHSEWERTFEGSGDDSFRDVLRTGDGGFLLVGSTESEGVGKSDGWIVKTDSGGDVQWSTTVGGPEAENFQSVVDTPDGNYLVVGETRSFDTSGNVDNDGWVVKVEDDGNVLWNKTFDTGHVDSFSDIVPATDGGYIVGGYSRFGFNGLPSGWYHKINSNGTTEWTEFAGSAGHSEYIEDIEPLQDGGYLLTGFSDDGESRNGWIRKIDRSRGMVWEKNIGGGSDDTFLDSVEKEDGKIILVGSTRSYGSSQYSGWFVQLNPNGEEISSRIIGGEENDLLFSITKSTDDGFLLTGTTVSYGTGDAWLMKLSGNLNEEWNRSVDKGSLDIFFSVSETPDDGYVLVGNSGRPQSDYDAIVAKFTHGFDGSPSQETISVGDGRVQQTSTTTEGKTTSTKTQTKSTATLESEHTETPQSTTTNSESDGLTPAMIGGGFLLILIGVLVAIWIRD